MAKSEKPHYHGHRKRLRERFLKSEGKDFADYEILEMLLFSSSPRSDVKPLAKDLINEFGSLAKVLTAEIEALKRINGIGETAITSIKIVSESSLRLLKEDIKQAPVLGSSDALLNYCQAAMAHHKTEQFRILFLDNRNKLIADEIQQKGTINHTPVYPREVVKRALDLSSAGIILIHNHPSGDPTPSIEDLSMTQAIVNAAAPLGIQVHDHLIIGNKKHYSFAANGLL